MHITQTEVVALIAVAGTLGSGGLSYLAARRSTEVQLNAINAEMERLRALHAEEGRRERQQAYYDFVTSIHSITQFVYGVRGEPTPDAYVELVKAFGDNQTRVMFLGGEGVLTAAVEMVEVFGQFASAVDTEGGPADVADRLKAAYVPHSSEWNEREVNLINAMKLDLGLSHF